MTDLSGKVYWTESFRHVKSNNNNIVDEEGNKWIQITATGYSRVCDNFFWPFDPRNTDNWMGSLPHTVSQVATMRERMGN